jgi:transposase InsO family protein
MGSKHYDQDQKLIILKGSERIGVREAAKLAGIHYTTIYEWKKEYETLGEKLFLTSGPSYPGRGIKEITGQQESSIIDVWKKNPGYGPGQVRNQLRRQGITISIRTVRAIMESNGYKPTRKRKSCKEENNRFEAGRPLELAQMDILEFYINKAKVYLVLLLDDFSRFILGWKLLESTRVDDIIELVVTAVNRYGKMEEILTDRGFVFFSWRGINRFEQFLENRRIDHTHASAHHPKTLGKVEACNKRLKNELIARQYFPTIHDAVSAIEEWARHYNYERPHQGIGGLLTPAERFHGQAEQALDAIRQHIDITSKTGYNLAEGDRSIINVVLSPEGNLTLWMMGRRIELEGGKNGTESEP